MPHVEVSTALASVFPYCFLDRIQVVSTFPAVPNGLRGEKNEEASFRRDVEHGK